ncbi:MAG: putative dsRNA-binding protein, partial [Thermanaerothrix sp.]|nr:putative dsRNA-binding protein [Thermanaerothrix sp.]
VLESLVGAVYLLAGWLRARALVWRLMATEINRAMEGELDQNYKSKLQELLQGKSKPLPNYQILRTEGPDHQKTFLVEVSLGDKPIGKGEGKSKKCAQQAAAKAALQFLLSHPEILNE